MKRLGMGVMAVLALSVASFALPKDRTFTGEISDGECAKMGSHDAMVKDEGLKSRKECTRGCVKMGDSYVLFNAAEKTVYQLDDQTKPAEFAGQKVVVTGTLDEGTKTIHVTSIAAAN